MDLAAAALKIETRFVTTAPLSSSFWLALVPYVSQHETKLTRNDYNHFMASGAARAPNLASLLKQRTSLNRSSACLGVASASAFASSPQL